MIPATIPPTASGARHSEDLPSPAEGIQVIQYSLRCFAFGLASVVPVLGLPLAVVTFQYFRKARATSGGRWNPAQSYLLWGSIFSSLGVLLSLLIVLFVICAVLQIFPWPYHQ